jgi:small subunit ribosomal protein S16
MAVKIRLKRMGAKKRPLYRVVVADARSPRDGRFIEAVGYYDPLKEPAVLRVDDERIRHWMATGARPSDVVRELLEREGMLPASPRPQRTKTGPRKPVPATPAASVSPPSPAASASPPSPAAAPAEAAAVSDEPEPPTPVTKQDTSEPPVASGPEPEVAPESAEAESDGVSADDPAEE